MELILKFPITPSLQKISYNDKVLLIGSCFTEEIGNRMKELKFNVFQNPTGIVYDPVSVARILEQHTEGKAYSSESLSIYNDLWHSWDHHSLFSDPDKNVVIEKINSSGKIAHDFIRSGNWIVLTFGSSFAYRLKETDQFVANCHKYPADNFQKELLSVETSFKALQKSIDKIRSLNPQIKFLLTVSPVRHIRDGIADNNRSKARLLELVHSLVEANENVFYFPSYEIVIDVLRDYRFYKEDMVHVNELGIKYVFEKFSETYFDGETSALMNEIEKLVQAKKHKPFREESEAFKNFMQKNLEKTQKLMGKYTSINFEEELNYFRGN